MTFDYVIVGSGAAGSVVAARLLQANAGTVCVIEAGGDNNKWTVNVPAGFVRTMHDPAMMWQFESQASKQTADRKVYIPQGKVLGGSTSINGLVYNRGQSEDFDNWASQGNPGWSYQDVLPYFRKAETFDGEVSQYRGASGPLRIGYPPKGHPLCDQFINAAAGVASLPRHNDYNAESQSGAGYYQRFIHAGKRENVATRYLKPEMHRHKLSLITDALVTRICFEGSKATGVTLLRDGEEQRVNARCEVLICAGTINSATLLQRSGIGDGSYLQSIGVEVLHDLPAVGQNLQDHFFARLAFRLVDNTDSLNYQAKGWKLGREIYRWLRGKPSILAFSPSIAYAFINSEQIGDGESRRSGRPDLQFVFSHGSYRPGRIYELDNFPAVTCGFTQQRPYSTGTVKITSTDYHSTPIVQPNYLNDERDRAIAVRGVKIARQIMGSAEFSAVVQHEIVPGGDVRTDDELLEFVRQTGNTGYHLVGTCRMGPKSDPKTVVDSELRIHGLEGIRVIDASVMPAVTSSNTCAATVMIGEKGADCVLMDNR